MRKRRWGGDPDVQCATVSRHAVSGGRAVANRAEGEARPACVCPQGGRRHRPRQTVSHAVESCVPRDARRSMAGLLSEPAFRSSRRHRQCHPANDRSHCGASCPDVGPVSGSWQRQSSAIGNDFGRFGATKFWDLVDLQDKRNPSRRMRLEQLNTWRNGVVHQDFNWIKEELKLVGKTRGTLNDVRMWRDACNALAQEMDRAVARQALNLLGQRTW